MSILRQIQDGDTGGALLRLRSQVAETNYGYRQKLTEHEKLTAEALWYLERGDADEAIHRLRLRDRPKFHSERQCLARYENAMAEKRSREAVA